MTISDCSAIAAMRADPPCLRSQLCLVSGLEQQVPVLAPPHHRAPYTTPLSLSPLTSGGRAKNRLSAYTWRYLLPRNKQEDAHPHSTGGGEREVMIWLAIDR